MFRNTSRKNCPWIVINANNKLTARPNAIRYVLKSIDYEGKKELKEKDWNFNHSKDRIKIMDVQFSNLNIEQYELLSSIKQII